jgi:hypothetical protein
MDASGINTKAAKDLKDPLHTQAIGIASSIAINSVMPKQK